MKLVKSARFVHMSASERKLKANWQKRQKPPAKAQKRTGARPAK